jgi:basic membrane protein A
MNKNRIVVMFVLLAVIMGGLFSGCKKDKGTADEKLKVALLITSQLGDRGFYDSAHNGMNLLRDELGAEVKTIEMGQDPSKYDPYIRDVADQDWDYIVLGSSPAIQIAEELIPQYPKKKFIMFDTEVDWSKDNFSNLYCVTYKQNEGSFLAGATAAIMTTEGKKANPQKLIGVIAGAEHPIISDFIIGYIQGAQAVDPQTKIAIAYAGTFIDSTKGKELGMAMMGQQGIDICFQVASQTGIGVLDAAKELNQYAIGVDGDQEAAFRESNPQMADVVVTSMMKRVDQSILRAVKLAEANQLPWGKTENIGLKEQGVGIIYSGNFQRELSSDAQTRVKNFEQKIINGEINVASALNMPDAEFQKICASVKP